MVLVWREYLIRKCLANPACLHSPRNIIIGEQLSLTYNMALRLLYPHPGKRYVILGFSTIKFTKPKFYLTEFHHIAIKCKLKVKSWNVTCIANILFLTVSICFFCFLIKAAEWGEWIYGDAGLDMKMKYRILCAIDTRQLG